VTLRLTAPPSPVGLNPPLSDRILRAVERALRNAWANILASSAGPTTLKTGTEPAITKLLYIELGRLRDSGSSPGYNTATFERPVPAAEFYDYQDKLVRKPGPGVFSSGPQATRRC